MLVERALNDIVGTPSVDELIERDDGAAGPQTSEPLAPEPGAPSARAPRSNDNPRPMLATPDVPGSSRARMLAQQSPRPVPTSLTPVQVLNAHPDVRARVVARLGVLDTPAAQEARRLLQAGEHARAFDRILEMREAATRGLPGETTTGTTTALRYQLRAIAAELRYPDRQRADIATRYAQFIREYGAMNRVSAETSADNSLWGSLENGGMDFLFNMYPAGTGNRTLMQDLDARNPLPAGMEEELAAVRGRVSDPEELIRAAATIVHRYTRGEEAHARGVVCRDAAEVFRKLIGTAGMSARIETITTPLGHAYNLIRAGGRELLVDAYFHPGGPIIMPRSEVEQRGFGTPNITVPPRF